jgi:hypothetical protein
MLRRLQLWTPLVALLALAGSAFGEPWRRAEIFLTSSVDGRNTALLAAGDVEVGQAPGVDYALFATELVAYLAKEVLHDATDEYDGSLLGSHLSRSMPDANSQFGNHCLLIVSRLGSALPLSRSSVFANEPPSLLASTARAAAAGLALHQLWSAFKNDVDGDRAGVSLNPKVSARRVGVNVTIHW